MTATRGCVRSSRRAVEPFFILPLLAIGCSPDVTAAVFAPESVLRVEIEIDEEDWDVLRRQRRSPFDLVKPGGPAGPVASPYT